MQNLKKFLSIILFVCIISMQIPVFADDNLEDDGEEYEINELLTAVRSRSTKST